MPLRVENRCAVLGFIGLRFKVGKLEGGGPRPPVWSDGVGQLLPGLPTGRAAPSGLPTGRAAPPGLPTIMTVQEQPSYCDGAGATVLLVEK